MSKVSMVSDEYAKQIIDQAKRELEELKQKNKQKKLSAKDALHREYMRTLVNNPTSLNIVFCMSGRYSDMIRKEEETTDGQH
jgi:hypothetical protein